MFRAYAPVSSKISEYDVRLEKFVTDSTQRRPIIVVNKIVK